MTEQEASAIGLGYCRLVIGHQSFVISHHHRAVTTQWALPFSKMSTHSR
jgi:hypothetical protein